MLEIQLTILNEVGLHARPASLFVQTAGQFEADMAVHFKGKKVNAKSILEVLTLGAGRGAEITVSAEGRDAEEALREIQQLVESDFEVNSTPK